MNLVKLCYKHRWMVTWADPDVPLLLDPGCPTRVSPSPSPVVLREPCHPEEPFLGFALHPTTAPSNLPPSVPPPPPVTHAVIGDLPPGNSSPPTLPAPLNPAAATTEWCKNRKKSKKSTGEGLHPSQQSSSTSAAAPVPESHPPTTSHHRDHHSGELPLLTEPLLPDDSPLPGVSLPTVVRLFLDNHCYPVIPGHLAIRLHRNKACRYLYLCWQSPFLLFFHSACVSCTSVSFQGPDEKVSRLVETAGLLPLGLSPTCCMSSRFLLHSTHRLVMICWSSSLQS